MRRLGIFALALLCLAVGAGLAQAQDKYPSKPIKIIVPYVPGGATDIVARILADQIGKSFGQSVIVENKPGACGIIASEMATAVVAQTPLGRLGQPEDIARVAVFLASDDAGWITGETLVASGGLR